MPAQLISREPSDGTAGTSRVILRFEDGIEREIEVTRDEFVLDAALRQNIPLIHQCRSGSCSTCVGRVESGILEMARDRACALIAAEIAEGKRLLCGSRALADSIVRLNYPSSLVFAAESQHLCARIASVEWPVSSVARLRLALDRGAGFAFSAGQYVRLQVPNSHEWRSYSMCSTGRDLPRLEFLVRIIPGGAMSEYLRAEARAGDPIELEGPLGAFILHPAKGLHIFVAGGTGVAPILAMLDTIRRGAGSKPKMVLSFGCASDKTFFYQDEIALRRWWMPELSVKLSAEVVEAAGTDFFQGTPVDALGGEAVADPDAIAYLCGPPPMIEAARRRLAEMGVAPDRIHAERFVASSAGSPRANGIE
jgi:ferredoxin-NADP reductase/ferredoxin